jgi:hypothetical protein
MDIPKPDKQEGVQACVSIVTAATGLVFTVLFVGTIVLAASLAYIAIKFL